MKLRDITIGEQYAVSLQRVRVVRVNVDRRDDDSSIVRTDDVVVRYLRNPAYGMASGAYDYGQFLETGELPTSPDRHRQRHLWDWALPFACATVFTTREPWGKTRLGVHVRVPFYDWWPYTSWWYRQSRDDWSDPPPEVLGEVYAALAEAELVINASQVLMRWVDLPQWRIDQEVASRSRWLDDDLRRIEDER